MDEPYETEPVDVPTRAEIQALFENVEKLRRELADEVSVAEAKRRARMARMMEDEGA